MARRLRRSGATGSPWRGFQRIPTPGGRGELRSLHLVASVAARDGGATTAVLNIVRALNASESTALIITTTADGRHNSLKRATNAPTAEDGAPVWFCRRSRPRTLKNSWQQGVRTLRESRSSTVMHIHGVYLANSIWGFIASKITGIPYVLQPHGTLDSYQQSKSARRKKVFDRLIGQRIIESASALVATSEIEALHLRHQYPKNSVVTIPLGVERKQPIAPDLLGDILDEPSKETSQVVFVGRLANKKRPELLLDVWNTLDSDAQLMIVGPEDDWTWDRLKSRLHPSRRSSVTYCGILDPPAVAWAMDRADVLVLPSENENFGLVIAEAMSHGCAIVSTAQTAATEHVRLADAGIVLDEPTEDSLRLAVEELLSDTDRTRQLGEAGQLYVAVHLTWSQCAQRLNGLYESVDARP